MPNLKKRFPFYSRTLKLYPKAYQRQYSNQILQTMADMLDAEGTSAFKRIKIWLRATVDLLKNIIMENLRSVDAKKFVPGALTISILLITPLCIREAMSILTVSNKIIFSSDGIMSKIFIGYENIWSILFPFAAVIIALMGIVVWNMNKTNKNINNKLLFRLNVVGLTLVSMACSFILIVTAFTWSDANDYLAKNNQVSLQYQKLHPTFACTILPEKDAKVLIGEKIYLNNDLGNNSSGILFDDNNSQSSMCHYVGKDGLEIMAKVQTAKNNKATELLRNEFNQTIDGTKPITIKNRNGYYVYDDRPQINNIKYDKYDSFNIRLWVDGNWLEVVAPNFETADKAMAIMISNLEEQKSAARQKTDDSLPADIDDLSANERMAITQAVQNQEPTITAGTSYTVNINDIKGKQITGTFRYENGIYGTFAVEKKHGQWQIVSYAKI